MVTQTKLTEIEDDAKNESMSEQNEIKTPEYKNKC
jgi:hypothetical protein